MDDSLFITETLHEKEIKGGDGKSIVIWVKELPNTSYVRLQQALASKDPAVASEAISYLVFEAVHNADGSKALTIEQARKLKLPVLNQMFNHAMAVNKDDNAGNA